MKHIQRRISLFLAILLILGQPANLLAAMLRTIHIEWDYNGEATSFRLYQENSLLCESFEPTALSMDCETFVGEDPISFTMTAMGPDGESPHSAPYTLTPPAMDAYGNYIPTASFSADATSGTIPLQVNFDASASSDFDGTIVEFDWDFGDGDVGAGQVIDHIFYLPGTYTTTLTVTDDSGASSSQEIVINATDTPTETTPDNIPPTAVINTITQTDSYQFDAYDSTDEDGVIVSYEWNFGDGNTASGSFVEHTYATSGNYSVSLTVKDDMDGSNTAITTLTVPDTTVPASPPTAVISTGTDKQLVTVHWEYNDTSNITGYQLYQNKSKICETNDPLATELSCLAYIENGPMSFSLKAIDTSGGESSFSEILTYTPSADTGSAVEGDAPLTVFFNSGTSTDPDNDIVSYYWDFGDGDTATTSAAEHTFNTAGILTVTLTVTDAAGLASTATTEVTVIGNTPPVAYASTITLDEDTTTRSTLKASDADGDPLTYSIYLNGDKGTAVLTDASTGEFTYTPEPNANGTDMISFYAHDGKTLSNGGEVTINIAPVNDEPTAQDLSLTTLESTPINGYIKAEDIDGDKLTYSISTDGTLGNAIITDSSTGAFTYTPQTALNGNDSFIITVGDGNISTTANVAVTITPVNDAPLAVDDTASTSTETPVTIPVLSNDSDPDGDALNVTAVSAPANGTTVISGDTIIYTPAANFSGEETFTYTISDPEGSTASATVTVTVQASTIEPTVTSLLKSRITFSWDYAESTNISGFNIYQNNSKICSTADPAARQLTCEVPLITKVAEFTLTSIDANGIESDPSNLMTYDPSATLNNYRQVTLSWNYASDSNVIGFRMYMNNSPMCQTSDPQARTISCLVPIDATSPISFSLTALGLDNTESSLSNDIIYTPTSTNPLIDTYDIDGDGDIDGTDLTKDTIIPVALETLADIFGTIK